MRFPEISDPVMGSLFEEARLNGLPALVVALEGMTKKLLLSLIPIRS
jgi:hypothetical protein